MLDLPETLQSWGPAFAAFPPDLATALAPFVERIGLAVGPLAAAPRSGVDDINGYDGVVRRGSYDRLLLSEWLLAEEHPDEFLRRATMSEHLFVQLATRTPAGGRRSIALFDAGPMQLGAPRLAQLASLIVLAQRAERAGTRFFWGVLQANADPVEGLTSSTVLRFLAGRSTEVASAADVERWCEKLALETGDDFWLVGDGSTTREGASLIVASDLLEVDRRRMSLTVQRRMERSDIVLDLPTDDSCARLLRDPFTLAPRALRRDGTLGDVPSGKPVFCADGRRLAVPLSQGGVAWFPLPTSRKEQPGRPIVLRPWRKRVVAAGTLKGRVAALTLDLNSKAVELVVLGKRGGVANRRAIAVLPDLESPGSLGEVVSRPDTGQPVCVVGGRLLRLDERVGFAQLVEALTVRDIVVYVGEHPHTLERGVWGLTYPDDIVTRGPGFTESELRRAFFGWHAQHLVIAVDDNDGWLVAAKDDGRPWRPVLPLSPGSGTTVFGAVLNGNEPSLLLVEDDRRTISIVGRETAGTVCRSRADIAHVTASSYGPLLAWVTVDGELTVRTLPTGEVLLNHREAGQ